jgi:hypothetical protein
MLHQSPFIVPKFPPDIACRLVLPAIC